MDFSTLFFWAAVAGLLALISIIAYQRTHAPTTPQYKTVSNMDINALVFFRTRDNASAFSRVRGETVTDKTAVFTSNGGWASLPIKSGTLQEVQVTNERPKRQFVEQTLRFDCSDAEVDDLQILLSWLRNDPVCAYVIAADGSARRLDNLEWLDFANRALVFQAHSPNVAPVVATYAYNVLADGSHSFYHSYYGGYPSGGHGIGYWLLG